MPDKLTYLYADTFKSDPETGYFEGIVNTGKTDVSGQIVDMDWLKKELPPWVAEWGNIRHQHDPMKPIGVTDEADLTYKAGPKIAGRVVVDEGQRNLKAGLYKGLSVGIKAPVIVKDAQAPNGRIVGGKLIEISLVDRPADDGAKLLLYKSVGADEWKDCQTGVTVGTKEPDMADNAPPGSPLAALKAAQPTLTTCDMDGCDCDCAPGQPDPDCDCECAFCAAARGDMDKTATPDSTKRDFDPNVGGGVDRDKLPASDFVDPKGRRFPIKIAKDVEDAVRSYGRADPKIPFDEFKRRLTAIAKRKGFESALPKEWTEDKKETKTVDPQTTPIAADAEKAKMPKSEPNHAHPHKGAHNHTHTHEMFGRMVTHTHAHLHDDDDMHEHTHLDGKDARILSPEDRESAMRMYAAEADAHKGAAKPDATKASPDWNIENPQPGVISRPGRIEGELPESNDFADAIRRIERLANQTDDRDGDVDFPENQGNEDKVEAPDFQGDNPKPSVIDPGKLELLFSATVKSIERLDARLAALESQTITKTADAMKTVAQVTAAMPDLVKAFDVIARDAEAKSAEIEALKTAHADILADLEKVKEMAQPPKGVVAVTKGIGIEPDRYLSAHDGREVNEVSAFIEKALAGDDNDRRGVAEQVMKALYAKNK